MVGHRLGDECIKNKAALLNYRTLIEKVGEVGKAQLLINMRDSIKIPTNQSESISIIECNLKTYPTIMIWVMRHRLVFRMVSKRLSITHKA